MCYIGISRDVSFVAVTTTSPMCIWLYIVDKLTINSSTNEATTQYDWYTSVHFFIFRVTRRSIDKSLLFLSYDISSTKLRYTSNE